MSRKCAKRPGLSGCPYCWSKPVADPTVGAGQISHKICATCVIELDAAERWNEPQVKQCPSCIRNIGAWLERCVPCSVGD